MPASVKMMLIKDQKPSAKKTNKRKISVNEMECKSPLRAMTELKSVPSFDPQFLAAKNPHALDLTIKFIEKTHTYYVKFHTQPFSCEQVMSTSGFVGNYFSHFDPDKIVKNMGQRTRSTKYRGMTNEQIKEVWRKNGEEASTIGTNFHFLLESFYNGMDLKPFDNFKVIQQFRRWHAKYVVLHKLVEFRSEQRMRTNLKTRLTGTADMLFALPSQNPESGTLKLVLRDWKFSKKISFSSPFPGSYGCCSHLDNCNYSKYLLQQNVYKYMLEKFYTNWKYQGNVYPRVEIVDMALAVFHDLQDDYQHIDIPSVQNVVEEMFLDREQQLKYLLAGEEKKAEAVIMGVIKTPTLVHDVSKASVKVLQQPEPEIILVDTDEEDDEPLEPLA